MPPKQKYSREQVIRAAMKVVEKEGIQALTARRVAAQLRCSTAPVYGHFANMEELAHDVMRETQRTLLEYTVRPYTDRVFLNMGTGVGMFACEHRRLYRALMLDGDKYGEIVRDFITTLQSHMRRDPRFVALSDAERNALLEKMWTYTHGLASLISVGLIKGCTKDYIIKSLQEVGADVIGATLARHKSDTGGE